MKELIFSGLLLAQTSLFGAEAIATYDFKVRRHYENVHDGKGDE